MKKLILIAIAFIGLQATAQQQKKQGPNKGESGEKMMNLSAEEAATLQTKKMTLALDLNESQQKEIQRINLENAKVRKAHMAERKAKKEAGTAERPSKEDRVKMMNAMLDHKIEMKAKMKTILNEEQYAKWEKAQARMGAKKKQGAKEKMKGKKKE
tara:strand:- start:4008 stop:4475 length:468 start_codon:yes stop_codon:yes gene_type:complete